MRLSLLTARRSSSERGRLKMEIARTERRRRGVERIDLPDEAATLALAKWLAGSSRARGFHRACRRSRRRQDDLRARLSACAARRPGTRAPSPTFTLMQVYEGPEFPVVHADFYRLRGAEELASSDGTKSSRGRSRWPNGPIAPPKRCRPIGSKSSSSSISPRSGLPPGRRARARRPRGAICAGAGDRSAAAARGLGRGAARLLQGDASVRAYERLSASDGATAILMISPPRPDGPILRYGKPYARDRQAFPRHPGLSRHGRGPARARLFRPSRFRPQCRRRPRAIEDFGAETIADERGPNRGALRRGDGAARRSARARAARRAAGRRRDLPLPSTMSRRCWSRSSSRSTGTRRRSRGPSALGRAHAFPRSVARRPRADPRASRRPGRCATITRRICTGSTIAKGFERARPHRFSGRRARPARL